VAKVVKGALKVIGAVASVVALIPSPIQPIAAVVATAANVANAALEIIAPTKPKQSINGSQTEFQLNPDAGIPYMVGRTFFAGNVVHRESWGKDNQYQGFSIVWSGGGPIEQLEAFQADQTTITFDGSGNANGSFHDYMWLRSQLGATPSPARS